MVGISSHKKVQNQFEKIISITPFLHKIESEEDYQEALSFIENLMMDIGDNPDDKRWPLLELASSALSYYEDSQYPELKNTEDQSGIYMIKILIDKYNLTQKDLPEIGSQGVVSEVLSGKRDLNTRQIRALSDRFSIDAAIFI